MENIYCVYMHTLLLDGRKYIGITRQIPEKRWGHNGIHYSAQTYFWKAIQKYGWNSFKHEILFENLTKEQACNKEIALIKLFNTQNQKYGFNMTAGGEGTADLSEEACQKIGAANTKYNIKFEILYQLYIIENKTIEEVAQILNISKNTLRYKLKKFGIKKAKQQKAVHIYDISKEALEYHYIVLQKTIKQCAIIFNCSASTISYWLKIYNIHRNKNIIINKNFISKEELEYQYITLNKSRQKCAEYFNCSTGKIQALMKKYNIKKDPELVIKNTAAALQHCTITQDDLYYQYIYLNKTQEQCAEYFKCTRRIIQRWLRVYSIKKDISVYNKRS